jgi:hypothetical protein
MIKLGFEMFAGAITAIVVAMKLHTTSPVGHIGVLSGTFRWLVVDMLPPLLCFLTMIIQVFILGRGGNHRFVYLIIITLCLAAYPLVVLVGTLSFYRGIVSELLSLQTQIDRESFLLVGWAVAGLPAIGVLCYVLYSRTRGIPPRGLLAGGRYASMWAMNNLESGYVIGEATTGAILGSFLWISGMYHSILFYPTYTEELQDVNGLRRIYCTT